MVMSKGTDTRERILGRAMDLASVVGLEGLSLGSLARDTGLSKSGLFAHFASKEDLQLQVLATAGSRFIDAVVAPALREPRGEPRVRALFENWLTWEQGRIPGGCPFVAATHELDDRPGPLREALVSTQRDWIDTLTTACRIAFEEGHFRSDLEPEQLAYDIYAVFLAFHLYHRLLRDPDAVTRAHAGFEQLLANAR